MAEKNTSTQVFGATILGGVAGALLALMLAPRSGKETRDNIRQSAEELQTEAKGKLKDIKSSLASTFDHAGSKAKKAKDKAVESIEEIKNQSQEDSPRSHYYPRSAWEEEV